MNFIRRLSIRQRVVIVAVIVVAVGAGWLWAQRGGSDDETLRLYGNVDIREVQLAFRQSGRIEQMLFDEGDRVQAGARMATLDARPYQDALGAADAAAQVAQAEAAKLQRGLRPQEIARTQAALDEALAAARNATRNFDRQSQLLATGAVSQKTVDAARAARDQAAAGVNAARAAHSQATEG
ncbi:MAG: biotin/lipoyl-binding protein, partial [Novosphingobium sp.]